MEIDLHTLFTGLVALVSAILGWLGKQLWSAVTKLKEDLSSLEVRVTRDYVSYDRLKDAMAPVMQALDEIKSSLSKKVDK